MDCSWNASSLERGIVVAAGDGFESLLPWWLYHLRTHTSLDVAFMDLGMRREIVYWCKAHGLYIDIKKYIPFFEKKKADPKDLDRWEGLLSNFEAIRPYWFAKPIAIMHSPFKETIYLDGDCEVRADLLPLFEKIRDHDLALASSCPTWDAKLRRAGLRFPNERSWNSGVIPYKQGSILITRWAEETLKNSDLYLGDEDILSRVIYEGDFKVGELDPTWNWNVCWGKRSDAKIYHYTGPTAKIDLAGIISAERAVEG